MTLTEMPPAVVEAVRSELAAIGTARSRLQRRQRRVRLATAVGAAVLVAGVGTAAAIVVNSLPGATVVTPEGVIHSATQTGTGRLELGRAPEGASRVILTVRCLTPHGSISVDAVSQNGGTAPDITTFFCKDGGRVDQDGNAHAWHMDDAALPAAGSTSITITADAGTGWTITGQYATSHITPWATNDRGQTYGQCNANGCPDLVGARATNGKDGYILTTQWDRLSGPGSIPVYDSDGTTVIGRFTIGDE